MAGIELNTSGLELEEDDQEGLAAPFEPSTTGSNVFELNTTGLELEGGDSDAQRHKTRDAVKIPPVQYKADKTAADEVGVDVGTVQRDNGELKREARAREIARTVETAPATKAWISRDDNINYAHDDVDNLSAIEKAWDWYTEEYLWGAMGAAGKSVIEFKDDVSVNPEQVPLGLASGAITALASSVHGIGSAKEALDRLISRPIDAILDTITGTEFDSAEYRKNLPLLSRGLINVTEPVKEFADELRPKDSGFAFDVSSGLGQMATQITVALLSGSVSSATSLGMLFGQGSDIQADMVKEAGKEGDIGADIAVLGGGVITALTEKYGLENLLKRIPDKVKGKIYQVLAGAGSEGAQEILENIAHNLAAFALYNPDQKLFDADTLYEGGVGATVGGITSAMIGGARVVGDRRRAKKRTEAIKDLNSKESNLRQTSPEKYAAAQGEFMRKSGIEDVEIDAEGVKVLFQDMPDFDLVDAQEVQEAISTGGTITMSPEQYWSLPQDVVDKIAPNTSFTAGEMTEQELTEVDELVKEFGGPITEDEVAAAQESISSEDVIFQEVYDQLITAGATDTDARPKAEQMAAVFNIFGERAGIDPLKVAERFMPSIRKKLPEFYTSYTPDAQDYLLERVKRAAAQPTEQTALGETLLEFIAKRGGIVDPNGEFDAADMATWQKANPFIGKLLREAPENLGAALFDGTIPENIKDLSINDVRIAAEEAGYLEEGSEDNDLLNAISEELQGRPVHSLKEQDPEALAEAESIAELLEYLERNDIPLDLPTREIKARIAALEETRRDSDVELKQDQDLLAELLAEFEDIPSIPGQTIDEAIQETHKANFEKLKNFRDEFVKKHGNRDGVAAWNDERIDDEIADIEHVSGNRTKGQIGFVDPLDFLMATSGSAKGAQRISDEAGDLRVDDLRGERVSPYLNIDNNGKIFGHEGRHRMIALAKAGVKRAPVMIRHLDGEYKSFKFSKKESFQGQEFSTGESLPVEINDLYSAEFGQMQNIKDAMPSDPQVLFQPGNPAFDAWFGDSKVVDENGEPLVVYHGTKATVDDDFAFDPKKQSDETRLSQQGVGFYFTENKKQASGYGKPEAMYLSVQNPLELKRGDNQNITRDMAIELFSRGNNAFFYDRWIDFQTGVDTHGMSLSEKAAVFVDYIMEARGSADGTDKLLVKEIKRAYKSYGDDNGYTQMLSDFIEVTGFDGAVEKINDDTTVYTAISPTQIKSVNNRGTFDPNDARILYQEAQSTVFFQKAAKEDKISITLGNLDYVKENYPDHYASIEAQLGKMTATEAKRVRDTLEAHKGTQWSLAAIRSLVIRDILHRSRDGQSIDDIADGKFWSVEEKVDWRNTSIVKAFAGGPEQIVIKAQGYNFFGNNRKAENDFSGSFLNCDPSTACATYCYSAGGSGGAPNGLMKAEFTEYMANNHPDVLADRLSVYAHLPAGLNGLALRMNEKGDLSEAQLKLIKELNKRGIRLQIFSKRPEHLRKVSDFNWRSLSIDETNMDKALDNPDLSIALIVTDNLPADFVSKIKDRLNVVLPVNLKGNSWTREQVLRMYPESKKEVSNALCPVEAGKKSIGTKDTTFATVISGLKKQSGTKYWTCTACDKLGSAGCFHGKNKSETVRKAANHFAATEHQSEADANKIRSSIEMNLFALLEEKEIDRGQLEDILGILNGKPEGSQREPNPSAAEVSTLGDIEGSTVDEGGRREAGSLAGGTELEQREKDEARGSIVFGENLDEIVINLFKAENLSTFLHESGHLYLEMMSELSQLDSASQGLKDDMATVRDWLGVAPGESFTTEHHEKWAETYEKYLMEGNAPSVKLLSAFAKFSSWLSVIYKKFGLRRADLNDDIRGVMDRMLASESEIEQARGFASMEPLFADAEQMGVTQEQFEKYILDKERAQEAQTAELVARTLQDVKRENTKWWNAEEKATAKIIEAELDEDVTWRAMFTIRRNKLPSGEPLPAYLPEGVKISSQALAEMEDAHAFRFLPKGLTAKKDGMHPDDMAPIYGFESGDQMLKSFMAMPQDKNGKFLTPKQFAKAEAKRRMLEEHGDIMNDGTMQEEALIRVHSENQSRLIAKELKHLIIQEAKKSNRDGGSSRTVTNKIAKETAKRLLAKKPVGQILSHRKYLNAEMRAAKQAMAATLKGDFKAAAEAKQRQLLNFHLYREARNAAAKTEKMSARLSKLKRDVINPKVINPAFIKEVKTILAGVSFGTKAGPKRLDRLKAEQVHDWAEKQEKKYGAAFDISPELDKALENNHYKDMAYSEFEGLYDTVNSVMVQGRRFSDNERNEFNEYVAAMTDSIYANATKELSEPDEAKFLQGVRSWVKEFIANHRQINSLSLELDGYEEGGLITTNIFRRIKDADDAYLDRGMKASERLNAILSVYGRVDKMKFYNKMFIPELGQSLSLSGRLAFALNMGNEGNVEVMQKHYSDVQIDAILKTLTEKDWDVVEAIWKEVDSYWNDTVDDNGNVIAEGISTVEERVTGVKPKKVEATPFVTPSGRKVSGGYYPLVADPRTSDKGRKDMEAKASLENLLGGGHSKATTKHGSTIERQGFGRERKILLDVSVAFNHIDGVIKDIEMREAVVEVHRIIQSPAFKEAVQSAKGLEYHQQFDNWLKNVAGGDKQPIDPIEKLVSYARTGASIAEMGLSLRTMLQQPFGITRTMVLIGEAATMKGVWEFARDRGDAARKVMELSPFMRNRGATFNRDVKDAQKLIGAKGLHDDIVKASFWGIQKLDMAVSIPTWLGAYDKAQKEGKNIPDSVAFADSIVARSQGSGLSRDLSQNQQGGVWKKLFTMFYTFFNAYYNVQVDLYKQTNFRSFPQILKYVKNQLWVTVIPSLVVDALFNGGPEDDEEWPLWAASTVGGFAAGGIVLARDVVNSATSGYGYQISPVQGFFAKPLAALDQIKQGEADIQAAKAIFMAIGYLAHVPGARTMSRAADVLADEGTQNLDEFEGWWRLLVQGKEK